jgi:hypothetical protein
VLFEDCCDGLGYRIGGRHLGTFGAAATYSLYAAHHVTTGEGGAVATDDPAWSRALMSLREWARDCWCPTGRDDVCGRRFEGRFGGLPEGFDPNYTWRACARRSSRSRTGSSSPARCRARTRCRSASRSRCARAAHVRCRSAWCAGAWRTASCSAATSRCSPDSAARRHRIAGSLRNPDRIVAAAIWVGCHPALDDAMVEWTAKSIADFLKIH